MKFLFFCLIFSAFTAVSCRTMQNDGGETSPPQIQPSPAMTSEPPQTAAVDLTRLASRSTVEVDKILGKPEIIKQIEKPIAEYRVYKIPNYPKGLAVRFYGDRAINFNLILSKPLPTSKQALREVFGIEVGDAPPQIDSKEPLSEVWRGTFNSITFAKIYAKREKPNGGFIFVLAEVAQ